MSTIKAQTAKWTETMTKNNINNIPAIVVGGYSKEIHVFTNVGSSTVVYNIILLQSPASIINTQPHALFFCLVLDSPPYLRCMLSYLPGLQLHIIIWYFIISSDILHCIQVELLPPCPFSDTQYHRRGGDGIVRQKPLQKKNERFNQSNLYAFSCIICVSYIHRVYTRVNVPYKCNCFPEDKKSRDNTFDNTY